MSVTSTQNWFVLLGLDPKKPWSDEVFQKALKLKKVEWTRKSNDPRPTEKLEAKKYLGMISLINEIMGDEKEREQQRSEALKQQSESEKKSQQEFNTEFQLLASKGFIYKSEVVNLAKKFLLLEADILDRANKIEVEIREEVKEESTKKLIDENTLKRIKERLNFIGKKNLYDFLEITNPKTSISMLLDAATNIYNQTQKVANKTSEVEARSQLTGDAKNIFQTEDMRQAYDIALQSEIYDVLKKQIDTLAQSSDRTIYAGQFKRLLELAHSKGLDLEKSKNFIKDQAKARNLSTEIPEIESIKKKIACIKCANLNDYNKDFCSGCSSSLKVKCPSCEDVSTVRDYACSKCSFPIGNEAVVRKYITDAKQLISGKLYDEAIEYLDRAKQGWTTISLRTLRDPLTEAIELHLKEARQKQQERITIQKQLLATINNRYFYEARTLLQRIDLEGIAIDLINERSLICSSIEKAEAELLKARDIEGQGRDTIDIYQNILSICKDCKPAKDALAKTPPIPASDLTAHVSNKIVRLTWRESLSKNISYTIVRKYQSMSISSNDGEQIATIAGNRYDDVNVKLGLPVFYAVYTNREGIMAAKGAELTIPVMLVDDVKNVLLQGADRQISLRWYTPENTSQVEVYRSTQILDNPQNGTQVEILDKTQAIDRSLQNGKKYYYTVYCLFKNHTGKLVASEGITIEGIPEEPPVRINDLKIEVVRTIPNHELKLSWEPTKTGNVAILQSSSSPGLSLEDVIPQSTISKYGELIIGTKDAVNVSIQDRGLIYFTPITLLQQTAYIGRTIEYANIDGISNLKVQKQRNELQIRWDWPSNCEKVILSYDKQEFPNSYADNNAVHSIVTLAQYKLQGYYLLKSTSERDYFIAVHAVLKKDGKEFVASGQIDSARVRVSLSSLMVIKYKIINNSKFFTRRKLILTIEVEGSGQLPELVLVRKSGGIPLKKNDGEVVITIPATQYNTDTKALTYELKTENHNFGKLFLADDKLYESKGGYIRINHPINKEMELS